jgi:hypothetical protein
MSAAPRLCQCVLCTVAQQSYLYNSLLTTLESPHREMVMETNVSTPWSSAWLRGYSVQCVLQYLFTVEIEITGTI